MAARRRPFCEQLRAAWRRADSALCVGLDPARDRLPARLRDSPDGLYEFCRQIVEATADTVCAFKPNIAFFAAERAEDALERLIGYIHDHTEVPVILDAKRGDMGNTAELYARELFERYDADAATVSPWQGWDSIEPYLRHPGRGVAILCHTSNPDSAWLQDVPVERPAYLTVARLAEEWDRDNLMLVVGATYPKQLARVRDAAPTLPLLVPGVGAQGGSVDAIFKNGVDGTGRGVVVNASRSIIYAGTDDGFAEDARRAALALRDAMRRASPA